MKIGWGRTGESQNSFCRKLWRYPFLTQAKEDFHIYYVVTPLNAFNLPWGLSGASDCIDFVITTEQKHDECASFQHSMSSHGIDITSGLYMHLFVRQCFCDMQIVLFLIYVLVLLLDQFVIKEKFPHDSGIIPKLRRGKKNYPQTWEGKSNQGGILKEIIWMSMFLYYYFFFLIWNMSYADTHFMSAEDRLFFALSKEQYEK